MKKSIYIEYKSDRKFLVATPSSHFYGGAFSKIMKTHNTFCIEMGACMTHFIARRWTVTGIDILTRYVLKVVLVNTKHNYMCV